MRLFLRRRRGNSRYRQSVLGFEERSRRRIRWFKAGIAAVTIGVATTTLIVNPQGRYLLAGLSDTIRLGTGRMLGTIDAREEKDAEWSRLRRQGIEETRLRFEKVYAGLDPELRRLMRYAGNDPEAGLLRWGNFNTTLLLPSTVFIADDSGRSYRFKPNTRSVWLRNITIKNAPLTFFLVPDLPELAEAASGTTAVLVEGSTQTTNSWGLRGPEPVPAPLRGIVLGDSYIQGMLIDDDHTPPECLARYLRRALHTGVSVLNTGHLGYSPEQYYYTLLEYGERFTPTFVVVNVFANDCGGAYDALAGIGDWEEGKYWLERIKTYCDNREILCLFAFTPSDQVGPMRKPGNYPGKLINILDVKSPLLLDTTDSFQDRELELLVEGRRKSRSSQTSPLYNGAIGDGHFSPAGSEAWAESVGPRLVGLLKEAK